MKSIGTFLAWGVKALPFQPLKVAKDAEGKRVIPGVTAFVDSAPEIPMGRQTGSGDWLPYSRAERAALAAEIKLKEERASKKEAKQAEYDAQPISVRAKVEAKKAAEKAKRAAKKAAPLPGRAPHTFVRVIRPNDRFIPPPALDKPMIPPPVSATLEAEATAKLETPEDRQARSNRLEAYKHKARPTWRRSAVETCEKLA